MIKKLILSSLVIATTFALTPISASAEWRHDSKGDWYTESDSYATGWRYIEHFGGYSWYLFGEDGYVKKGWFQDGGNWYYGCPFITTDRYVDGYYLNRDGILTSDTSNAKVKESSVKATLEIVKKLEALGWVKKGIFWDAEAWLTLKTDSEYIDVNTTCTIKDGVTKISLAKAQSYEEWQKGSTGSVDLTLDEYLKYKSEGRIGSFTYKHGMSYPLLYTAIIEYLRNEPVKTNDTSTSVKASTSIKWHSSDYSKYQTLSEKNQENQNKN